MTSRRISPVYLFISVLILIASARTSFAQEIVLYASQAPTRVGNWTVVADGTAAGGARLVNPDAGLAKITTASPTPSSYVELTFAATAGKPYHIWIRGKAQGDSPYNDSVFVQFSSTVTSTGSAIYRTGTTSAAEINLENCMGCGLSGWGWQDNGWGGMGPQLFFQTTGTQVLRIQTREDGLSIDQIVISPGTYLNSSPGALKNDTVILPASSGFTTPSPTPTPTPTPIPTPTPTSSSPDIVIWAANVPSTGIHGNWLKQTNTTAAGQIIVRNPDRGAAKITTASASPADYFDVTFNAEAGKQYRLWLRGQADNNYWGNDSVFVQFSGSLNTFGQAAYRIGTTGALEVNLEDCSGCGLSGWGWQDDGWGINILGPTISFQTTGPQTLRIQTREDGISIDQIVLSSYGYLFSSPGFLKNDNTILQSTIGAVAPPPNQAPQVSISATPTSGNSPLFVSFASAASDPDGFISSYFWTFGDGGTSTAANPTHTYAAGSYTALLTVTDNAGATSSATVQINVSSPPPPPTTTGTLRVLTYNLQFGKGTDNVLNWDRTATWIANINPDIAQFCEVPPDGISTLVNSLSQKTGRTWYSFWVPKAPGINEGNLILSKYSFISTSSRYLSYTRSVAQVTISVAGRTINFFGTHLDDASSANRYTEVGELMSFAAGFSENKIVCGDFNAGPDTSESIRMTSSFYDSWMQAMSIGTAVAYPDNPVYMHTRTRRGRIDYVWYSTGAGNLVLRGTQIPDTRDLNNKNVVIFLGTPDDYGVRPSDHNPMIANFDIR